MKLRDVRDAVPYKIHEETFTVGVGFPDDPQKLFPK